MARRKRKGLGSSPQEHRSLMTSMLREAHLGVDATLKASSCHAAVTGLERAARYSGAASAHAGVRSAGDMQKDLGKFDVLTERLAEAREHTVRVCRKGS